MSVRLALILGAALCLHTFCSLSDSEEPRCQGAPPDRLSLARNKTDFAFTLYKRLAAQSPGSNIIFSPISVSIALALQALGTGCHTNNEILQGLKFKLTKNTDKIPQGFQRILRNLSRTGTPLQLHVNTNLFLDQQLLLKKGYIQRFRRLYSTSAVSTDFRNPAVAEKLINDYVEQKIQREIKKVFYSLNAKKKMVLVNSVLFKAKWKMPFDPDYNFISNFYVSPTRLVQVLGTSSEKKNILYFWDEKYSLSIVQHPYMDGHVSMLLILPNNGAMPKLEAELNMDMIYFWRNSTRPRQMTMYLPKFYISRTYKLEEVQPKLSMVKYFSQRADFSVLTTAINSRRQVVLKFLPDKGTEETLFRGNSNPPPGSLEIINFNRPFMLIVISEDTQNILFLGKVENPKEL
ncbi:serpin A3-8-like [Sorex fumeus]|uniref:serpin A3-8-like n=1 Tax=Sorex fumeus TaxID=62283 RepID=UPI0024AE7973|nr:serpin A3-8-like [Sorex fumeus]